MDAVRQKLVETGQYQQIQNETKQQLIQSGWYDQVNALAVREVSLVETPNLEVLTAKLEQQALAMIPEEIRASLLAKVQASLNH